MTEKEIKIFEELIYQLKQINESLKEMNYYSKKSNEEISDNLDRIRIAITNN